jgi:hypothetical protein
MNLFKDIKILQKNNGQFEFKLQPKLDNNRYF